MLNNVNEKGLYVHVYLIELRIHLLSPLNSVPR